LRHKPMLLYGPRLPPHGRPPPAPSGLLPSLCERGTPALSCSRLAAP